MQIENTQSPTHRPARNRYETTIEASKRVRWDIDRTSSAAAASTSRRISCPTGCRRSTSSPFLSADERRLLSQIQGRTYANMFGLVERFISAKVLEVSRDHWFGDQEALEALVRFTDEELKHQELFRRIEQMIAAGHARGLPVPAPAERGRRRRARQVAPGRCSR